VRDEKKEVENLVWKGRTHLNELKEVFIKLYRMKRINDFMLGKVDYALYALFDVLAKAEEGELELPPVP